MKFTARIHSSVGRESQYNAFMVTTLRLFIEGNCTRMRRFRVAAQAQRERQRWIEELTNDPNCMELIANKLDEKEN